MLWPALKQAREKAQQTVCIGRLKQIGLATFMYADDYGGYAPTYLEAGVCVWSELLFDSEFGGHYLPDDSGEEYGWKGLTCPSYNPTNTITTYTTYGQKAKNDPGYCWSIFKTEQEDGGFSPSDFLLYGDSVEIERRRQCTCFFYDGDYGVDYEVHTRHSGRASCSFADGSVRACSKAEVVGYGFLESQVWEGD